MKFLAVLGAAAALTFSGSAQAATQVAANSTTLTPLGIFGPGTYSFTTAGIISLTGGSDFLVNADGLPQGTVTTPGYGYFNPQGSFLADGNCGPAGCGIKIGALAGTFDPAGAAASFFLLGTSSTFNFTQQTALFGLVNDTGPSNNTGSFSVSVAAVPEPAAWAMMLLGMFFVAGAMRSTKPRQKLTMSYA